MAKAGTIAATLEHETWPHLAQLAKNVPEAGVHFQSKVDGSLNDFSN
jgi:hypothetical protein